MGTATRKSRIITEVRKAKAAYAREYRRKNPEKIKEIQERYWLRQAEKLAAENK